MTVKFNYLSDKNIALKFMRLFILIALFFIPQTFAQQKINSVKHPEWSYNQTIYEVNIRQFTKSGTFKEFETHLPRLKKLGVGILWLMPINPIGEKNRKGTLGSYYSVKDYLDVNPEFGTLDDFKSLVNEIHKLGMRVIIDWVANHTAWDNDLINEHPDWFTKDSLGNFVPPVPDWHDTVDLNYDNKNLWSYMKNAMKSWVEKYNIDGFRCDVASKVPTDFWIEARKELDAIKPVFMLAESDSPELHQAFDMTYDWKVYHTLNEIAAQKQNLDSLKKVLENDEKNFPQEAFRMEFTTNHDENSWNGTAVKRLGAALEPFSAFTFIIPGMPLIYNGQEAGLNKKLNFFEKDTIDWTNLKYENFYQTLVELKKNNKTLQCGERGGKIKELKYSSSSSNSNEKNVFPFIREEEGDKIFAIFNFSNKEQSIKIDDDEISGEYKKLFSNDEIKIDKSIQILLPPWGYQIYVK